MSPDDLVLLTGRVLLTLALKHSKPHFSGLSLSFIAPASPLVTFLQTNQTHICVKLPNANGGIYDILPKLSATLHEYLGKCPFCAHHTHTQTSNPSSECGV